MFWDRDNLKRLIEDRLSDFPICRLKGGAEDVEQG